MIRIAIVVMSSDFTLLIFSLSFLAQVCCAALAATEGEPERFSYNYNYDSESNGQQGHYQPGSSTYRFTNDLGSYSAPMMPNSYSGQYDYPGFQATGGAYQPFGYSGSNSFGMNRFSKREAEAKPEAEADAFYNSFYNPGYNMAYSPYHYPTVYARNYYQPSYNNFGYRSFYGKREAEAEPKADAFYNSFYPAYNMGYPYSRGSFYSGYRNFYQPSYYGGYGHF